MMFRASFSHELENVQGPPRWLWGSSKKKGWQCEGEKPRLFAIVSPLLQYLE